MSRLTKRYKSGIVTLDADVFMETQETIDREIQNCYPAKTAVERLAEYEDAEEKGLILRLPCKVGDTVWVNSQTLPSSINTWICTKTLEYEELPMFFEARVVSIKYARRKTLKLAIKANCFCRSEYGNCEYTKVIEYCNKSYPFSAVGKTVFLTREEAEQAMKEDKQRAETEEV